MAEMTRDKLSLDRIRRLKIALFLTSGYLAAEVIGGILTNSLALIADAGHMATDAGGLALALFAISYARRPASPQRTYGFYRMEILASLTNGVVLISLSIYIFYEAYRRIFDPPEIQSLTMIVVAAIGLVVNFIGMRLIGEHSHGPHSDLDPKDHDHDNDNKVKLATQSLNIEGARLELLSDTLGSMGVIAAGLIILATNFYLADPIVSIGLAIFILPRTWSLIRRSINILMEGVPSNISYEEVKKAILEVKGVTGVFDIHIWTITSGMDALSAHVVVIDPSRSQTILQELNSLLEKRFGIAHATIQVEGYHSESDTF